MNKYEVTKLSDKTPKAECDKLQSALASVKGVDKVQLMSADHRVSISFREKQQPKHDELQAAATKAGFPLGAKV